MFYALIKQWEDNTKPETQVFFSDRLLARILKKNWGTNVRDTIVKSLRKLRSIPLEWINSYHHKTGEGKAVLRERIPFTILSELKIVERELDGVVNKAVGYFKFDDRILGNLLSNYTKPLLLETILQIKSDIGQLLYVHIDLMLARKNIYERRTKDLFQDLGLTNPEYNRQYERYRALKKALEELQGLSLSTGVLKSATIEKTKDGLDYKTIFKKVAVAELDAPEIAVDPEGKEEIVINDYSKPKVASVGQPEELVQFFHKVFHGVDDHSPQSKETGQALSLISQYGPERAKHIVLFARGEAAKTNYQVQHFGAILNYASRGNADFDLSRQQEERTKKILEHQARRLEEEQEHQAKGEARLVALTPEQYQTRFESARAILFRKYPFMARQNESSKIHQGAIRSIMIRELENEPMDLLCITPPGDEPKA